MPQYTESPLLIAFAGLNRYSAQVETMHDVEVATVMAGYYELVAAAVGKAGGNVLKFIGDTALAVFPPEAVDRGVLALLDLKDEVDRLMIGLGWQCRMVVKVHYGTVAAGMFGAPDDRRYDVLGRAVNIAARLDSQGVALSVEAFRQLGPELRRRFKKHTPPITYIRQEDPHRSRLAKHR